MSFLKEKQFPIPIVYIPASIDHGLPDTHATLGFDTALNVIVESCDKITDSAQAMDRVAMVDTMGGGVGALTLMGALAAGAECAIIAEDFSNAQAGAPFLDFQIGSVAKEQWRSAVHNLTYSSLISSN